MAQLSTGDILKLDFRHSLFQKSRRWLGYWESPIGPPLPCPSLSSCWTFSLPCILLPSAASSGSRFLPGRFYLLNYEEQYIFLDALAPSPAMNEEGPFYNQNGSSKV